MLNMEGEILNKYKLAGKIASKSLQVGSKLIRPGESAVKIIETVDDFIKSKGIIPAFPTQISINNVAAHFCPTEESDVTLNEGDVVKLDSGTCVDGYIADNAVTIDLGNNKKLVNASRKALNQALKIIRPGIKISELGVVIQDTITSNGFAPVKNLSGHGLGFYEVHDEPAIPNYKTNDDVEFQEDQVVAIEPFASSGAGVVYESSNPTIFTLSSERPVRSMITREVLREIKNYKGLPFTTRWLMKKFGAGKTAFALRELKVNDMLEIHPPLLDKAQGIVSQAEHSVVIQDKPIIITKWDDD